MGCAVLPWRYCSKCLSSSIRAVGIFMRVKKFGSIFQIISLRLSISIITVAIAYPRCKNITGNLGLPSRKTTMQRAFHPQSDQYKCPENPHDNVTADGLFWRSARGFLKLEETDSCDQYESYLSWNITEVPKNVLAKYESEG